MYSKKLRNKRDYSSIPGLMNMPDIGKLASGDYSDIDDSSDESSEIYERVSELPRHTNSSTIHDKFIGLNDGGGIFSYYNCGPVASSVAEFFLTGVLNKPKTYWFPVDMEKELNSYSQQPKFSFKKISIQNIEAFLSHAGKGSHAIVGAEYSPEHKEGRYLFGLREKDWGHYFNIYYHGDGKFSAIDAYSSKYLEKSKNYKEYIDMYVNTRMQAFIFQGDSGFVE
ncbi:hypothetical protein [Enterobacter roggenkampii]|uniref:hypothetical protein n=1 Tax=Enterobacter roggenkampii TaxID=1812935 RepID=UPI002DBC1522|nr:hypothetical protein [Enterobacter roggenkampii]MEB5890019.1 hypothetical protein [Enterobacter roggenkampii]